VFHGLAELVSIVKNQTDPLSISPALRCRRSQPPLASSHSSSTNAALSQGNGAVGSAIVEVDAVAIRPQGVSTREYDIIDVAVALVLRLRPNHPRISTQQRLPRTLQIEERQPMTAYADLNAAEIV